MTSSPEIKSNVSRSDSHVSEYEVGRLTGFVIQIHEPEPIHHNCALLTSYEILFFLVFPFHTIYHDIFKFHTRTRRPDLTKNVLNCWLISAGSERKVSPMYSSGIYSMMTRLPITTRHL